jgi:hypothetical protein
MSDDPHGARDIPIGTPVIGFNGARLGQVREAHPHYIRVQREGEHEDLEVPVHAIQGVIDGTLHVSVNETAATAVDGVETAHRLNEPQI